MVSVLQGYGERAQSAPGRLPDTVSSRQGSLAAPENTEQSSGQFQNQQKKISIFFIKSRVWEGEKVNWQKSLICASDMCEGSPDGRQAGRSLVRQARIRPEFSMYWNLTDQSSSARTGRKGTLSVGRARCPDAKVSE